MSKRDDIIEPNEWVKERKTGLVYSEILGWIDIGHAQGNDIKLLMNQLTKGENGSGSHYRVLYKQDMFAFKRKLGTGKFVNWEIKKGLSINEMRSIALAMMMACANKFENYQSSRFFSWYTDSGYSGEDLTSDLLGFYRAILPSNYQDQLKLVSKENALRRWDYYGPIGSYQNKGFLPLLFPDPKDQCVTGQPIKGKLPAFMTWVHPYSDFSSGRVKVLTEEGTSFYIYL